MDSNTSPTIQNTLYARLRYLPGGSTFDRKARCSLWSSERTSNIIDVVLLKIWTKYTNPGLVLLLSFYGVCKQLTGALPPPSGLAGWSIIP